MTDAGRLATATRLRLGRRVGHRHRAPSVAGGSIVGCFRLQTETLLLRTPSRLSDTIAITLCNGRANSERIRVQRFFSFGQ
jgi:hypothetical protein